MMFRFHWLLGATLLLTIPVIAQQGDEPAPAPPPQIPSEGFWPTPKMIELFIDEVTRDGIERYQYDEFQLEKVRQILKQKVPAWMNEHRAELMNLTNEFTETQFDRSTPPDPEKMAAWARRVLPLVSSFEGTMVSATDELREYLNDDQIVILEGEVAAFRTGIQFATNKMRMWENGEYDPEIDWPGGERHREYTREEANIAENEMNQARTSAIVASGGAAPPHPVAEAGGPPPTPAPGSEPEPGRAAREPITRDEWAQYVDAFIQRYDLDADQQSKARTHLKAAQTQRDDYLRRKTREMRELEQQFAALKSSKEAEAAERLKAAEAKYGELYKPVENMFDRLKEKLEKLPRREQHRKVREREGGAAVREAPGADKP
jgi:hypothetical protein